MGKRGLIVLHSLSSWCLVIVVWLFLAVPRGCLQFVIVMFPNHTHYFLFALENTYVYLWVLYDFLVTVKAAPHECVIMTGQP